MLGGFHCSRNTLIGLNIFYIVIGIILICLGSHWSSSNRVSSLPIISGIVACGIFLILVSLMGIVGTWKHHQVLLFFYMIIIFLVFLVQFSVALACLSVSDSSQLNIAQTGWTTLSNRTKADVQNNFECCGFNTVNLTAADPLGHPDCTSITACTQNLKCEVGSNQCCSTLNPKCSCPVCKEKVLPIIGKAFGVIGNVSLFFSFTEIIGVILAYRFRNVYHNHNIGNTGFPKASF